MNTATNTAEKRLTSYRITPLTIDRLKTLARQEKVSVNTLVDRTLTELVSDIRSEEEMRQARLETEKFISDFAGAWAGPEYDGITEEIQKTRTIRKAVEL